MKPDAGQKKIKADKKLVKENQILLSIDALSSDGSGIARTENGVVFVPGALPGEVVAAEIFSRRKDFSTARLLSIEQPAKGRIERPRCPHYRPDDPSRGCGGCQLQHAEYSLQLRLKAGLVRDAMTRIGGFAPELFQDLECVPSPQPWGYRNKASFPVQSLKGRTVTGFYRAGTHYLELIRHCPVNAGPLNALYENVLEGLPGLPLDGYDERTHQGKLRHLVMRAGLNTGQTLLSFVINGRLSAKSVKALAALGSRSRPTTLTLNHNSRPGNVILGPYTEALLGNGLIAERLSSMNLLFDTSSFFQVNTAQAEQLFAFVGHLAEEHVKKGGSVLELYSGVGSLTCYLASKNFNSVTSIEEWRGAVRMAERNTRDNGFDVRTLCGRAEDVIQELHAPCDAVVMDPPRDGCNRAVLEAIHRLNVPTVIYVSCNPATLARDCRILAGHGYRIEEIRPFDMFPQTAHVETVVLMSREL